MSNIDNKGECQGCRHKATPRTEETRRNLDHRLNRMIGQMEGIKKMVADNRYCGDILIQVAAIEKALQGFGYIVLEEHMSTCMVEEIQKGNREIIAEAVDLVKKLK